MADRNALGIYLKSFRDDNNLDVDQMTIKLNVSRYYLHDLEYGVATPSQLLYDTFVSAYRLSDSEAAAIKSKFGVN